MEQGQAGTGSRVVACRRQGETVLCCEARTWALAIGWLQAVGSVIVLVSEMTGIFTLNAEDKEAFGIGLTRHLSILLVIIEFGIWLVEFLLGVVLIWGVKQENPRKVLVWLAFKVIAASLTAATALWRLILWEFGRFAFDLIRVGISCFFIWVVNIHRRELIVGEYGKI